VRRKQENPVNFPVYSISKPVDGSAAMDARQAIREHLEVLSVLYDHRNDDPPAPGGSTLEEALTWFYGTERPSHPDGRPWIAVCMVSSLDGSIAVAGRSGGLSSTNDAAVLRTLRQQADVVIVGAGTVRDEQYGAPAKVGQRIGVITTSGRLDLKSRLFSSGAGFVICPDTTPELDVPTLRAGRERVDLDQALSRLEEITPGARFVLAEGGAQINGQLLASDLIDELNLTMSPQLVGGSGPRLASSETEFEQRNFGLAHLLVDEASFLFSRWVRQRPAFPDDPSQAC